MASNQQYDVPKNVTVPMSVEQYAEMKVFMATTEAEMGHIREDVKKMDSKVDKLVNRIEDHMDHEEKAKKKIMWAVVAIAAGVILNALGVPVADFIKLFGVVGP